MVNQISEEGYKTIFYNSQIAMLIVAPNETYTMLDVNDAYLFATNTSRQDLVGKSVFAVFPGNPTDEVSKNIERTYFSFEQAILTKAPHTMSNYRYDIPIRGTDKFEERYWTTTNTPILNSNGEVIYFIHSPSNVTEIYKLREREQAGVDALKRQREQLYNTFMQAPVGIAIFRGPDYIVDLINPPLCQIYGKTVDEMIGKSLFEVLSHVKGLGYEQLLDEVRLTGVPYKAQASAAPLMRNEKLETVYLNFVYEPFYEDDGIISGVIAVVLEVTEEVLAKQLIEEAEERVRLAVDAVDLGTFDLNLLNGEMSTSTLFANIFGFASPVARSEYIKVFHEDDLAPRLKAHDDAIKTGILLYEARVIWPDKTIHWAHIEGKVYYNKDSEAIRILGTAVDITERRQAREEQQELKKALADSEHLLRNITTAAPTGLWMSDEKGSLTYVNQTWVDWIGLSYESQLGFGWLHSILDQDRERVMQKFLRATLLKQLVEVDFRIVHVDGTIHWCEATGRPQYDKNEIFTGYIGSCVDITDQKRLQQQKDDFIGIASHELKTPVTSIKAYTQILERMLIKKGDDKGAAMINKMDLQINRLTILIGDLLDVTKINSGKLQFNDRNFEFNELVSEIVEDLQRTTEHHQLIENLENIGIVYGDKERIGQVITNLISNAIKYSPDGKEIIIYTRLTDHEVILCVEDFGVGIAEDKLSRVFEQFYRVSGNMQHTFPGLGLGLYISAEIIKREHGRIWVNSTPGSGSKFCFALPMRKK